MIAKLLANRYLSVALAMLVTVALPFILKPRGEKQSRIKSVSQLPMETLVVLTPHVESIRREFGLGFASHMAKTHNRNVEVQWRTPGGTSEIDRYLDTEFRAAFESYWRATGRKWDSSENLASIVSTAKPAENWSDVKKQAREEFLKSAVGIKIDVFFGGGVYDFEKQKKKGYLVPTDATGTHGPLALKKQHPDWFSDAVIPPEFAGDKYHDPDFAWIGSCLSSFGIIYNQDVLTRKHIKKPPAQWSDLADPQYVGAVALADPSKSASAGKAFEMILQQEIQRSLLSVQPRSDEAFAPGTIQPPSTPEEAVSQGWTRGLQIIQKIGANARYFTDAAPKPPSDVSKGDAAAGMCIDFYGRAYVEKLETQNLTSRVTYVAPEGGSAVTVDPIAMFRGAQQPELATKFLEFVLSKEGQRLWTYRVGTPGGPTRTALRRQPVRKDMYTPEELAYSTDPLALPYQTTTFVYKPEYTAQLFNVLRVIIKAMCIETHEELRDAWIALQENNFPTRAMDAFQNVTVAGYSKVSEGMVQIMSSPDKVAQARLARDLAANFRNNYQRAKEMARAGN